jgi:hypothetical protein
MSNGFAKGRGTRVKPDAVGTNRTDNAGITADGTTRFLRELRQLRDEAGLEPAELAARAHYPHHVIEAAEAGPSLPNLPVLSAYVRGCGAVLTDWEERWRSLNGSPAAPICLPARPVGCSSLASAGARATTDPPVDLEAQRRIMAAITKAPAADAVAAIPSQARALTQADARPTSAASRSVAPFAARRPDPQSSTAECVIDGRAVPAQALPGRIVPQRTAPKPATDPVPANSPAPLMPNDSVPAANAPSTVPEPSGTLAVRPQAPIARRQPNISRAKIVTVAAVVFAVGAIIMLLLRKG